MIGKLSQMDKRLSQESKTEARAERPSDSSLNVVASHIDPINDILMSPPSELITANSGDSLEEVPKTASDDDQSKNQLLDKLQVVHQNISSMKIEEQAFLRSFSQWAIQTPEYQDWVGQKSCQVLWVTGGHGSGKTALLQSLVQRLLDPDSKLVSEPIATVAYFVSDIQPKSDRRNLALTLKSLIWQVLKSQPQLSDHLEQKLHDTGRECFDDPNDFYAMSTLLCTLVRDEKFGTTCFVIDEIEELCDESHGDERHSYSMSRFADKWGQRDILELIGTTSRLSNRVKWIVSTRDANIDFSKPHRTQPRAVHIHLSSTIQDMQHAMKAYVAMKMSRLAEKVRLTSNLQSKISELLLSRSPGNNFLWLDMVFDIVAAQVIPWNAPRVIQGLATDVPSLYRQRKKSLSDFGEENEGYCNIVLSTVMIAFRPLSLDELQSLASLPAYDIVIIIEKICFTFLEIVDNKVYFKYSSAREYLRNDMKENGDLSQMHLKMVKHCLRVTLDSLRLPGDTDKSKMVNYASIYWIRHLAAVEIDRALDTIKYVNGFLKDHLLQWLELLVSQGLLAQAREYLQITESLWAEKTLEEIRPHSNRTATAAENDVLDSTACLQNFRISIRFLDFHQSLHNPQGLSPRNSLLFYPHLNELKKMLPLEEWPEGLTIAPNIGTASREIGSCEHFLTGHTDWIYYCAYSPDGRLIATVSDDRSVRLWDSNTGKVQHVLELNFQYPREVVFSSEQQGILAVRDSSRIQLWDVSTGAQVNPLPRKELDSRLSTIVFSLDGDFLRAATVRMAESWHLSSHKRAEWANLEIDENLGVVCARFSSDIRLLALACEDIDYEMIIWDLENSKVLRQLGGYKSKINDLAFSPDSHYLAFGSDDCTLRLWHIETGELKTLDTSPDRVSAVAFSPDGLRLACGAGATVRTWKAVASAQAEASYMRQYEEENVLRGHLGSVLAVRFSPDGRRLLSSSYDMTARTWRLDLDMTVINALSLTPPETDGQEISPKGPLLCHERSICFVTFSVDGKLAASGSFDGKILLWDADKGTPIRAFTGGHVRPIKSLAFSRNGKVLISTSNDGTVGIWDANSGKMMRKLEGHRNWVRSAVLSPDEQFVASASDDRTVRVWNIKDSLNRDENRGLVEENQDVSGELIIQKESRLLSGHQDYVFSVAFSSDGRYLASGGDEGRILIWDLRGDVDDQQNTLRKKDNEDHCQEAENRETPCAELDVPELYDADADAIRVRSLVFSPNDSETLISTTATGTICVWKRGAYIAERRQWEWQCTESFTKNDIGWNQIDRNPLFLHFDLDHPEILLSEYGALPVKATTTSSSRSYALASSTMPPYWSRYGLRERDDQVWITRDNENLVFLPQQYRPSDRELCTALVQRQKVIIGCESGQVLIFGFAEDKRPSF